MFSKQSAPAGGAWSVRAQEDADFNSVAVFRHAYANAGAANARSGLAPGTPCF